MLYCSLLPCRGLSLVTALQVQLLLQLNKFRELFEELRGDNDWFNSPKPKRTTRHMPNNEIPSSKTNLHADVPSSGTYEYPLSFPEFKVRRRTTESRQHRFLLALITYISILNPTTVVNSGHESTTCQ